MTKNKTSNNVVGWLMAWLPKGGVSHNFEFFAETGSSGRPCLYSYVPPGNGQYESSEVVENVTAMERANFELNLLKKGKITKYGMEVVDGYIVPVIEISVKDICVAAISHPEIIQDEIDKEILDSLRK